MLETRVVAWKNAMLWFFMLLVGLTGGLASGKTTVARMFESYGAYIIDADILAREVVQQGKPAWRAIVKTFGKSILTSDEAVDRAALAKLVFQNSAQLKQLTDIIYPRVVREQVRVTRQVQLANPQAVIIYDAAMLIEAQAYRRMDQIVVVKADRKTQIERACRRGGLSKAEALRRLKNQMPLREKLRYADYVIDGTLPLKQLRSVVGHLYAVFHQLALARMTSPRNLTPLKAKGSDSPT